MYQITQNDSTLYLTDKLLYIRVNPENGVYIPSDKANAEGFVAGGKAYLYRDGYNANSADGGTLIMQGEAAQADTEQALVEEDQLLDTRLADIETALVELDQRTGGI